MTVEWLATWPVALAALGVLLLPGVLPAYALGLRGLVAWGAAPLLGGAVTGMAAVLAALVGVAWAWWVPAVASLVVAVPCWLVRILAGRGTTSGREIVRHRGPFLAVLGVAVVAVGWQVHRMLQFVGGPEHIAQTFDTPYHLNSVAQILDTGDASSLHMNLTQPEARNVFYPGLWHGITALVVQLTGTQVPIAANWVAIVCCTVVWTLGLLALTRTTIGSDPLFLGLAAPLAFVFTQFPNRLFSFGLLYPNLLAYALLPAATALCALALVRTHGRRRLMGIAGAGLGVVALTLAQPNAVFALGYVLIPLGIYALVQVSGRLRRRGRSVPVAVLPWVVTVVACVAGYRVLDAVPLIAEFRGKVSWNVAADWWRATYEALTLGAMHPWTYPDYPDPAFLNHGTPNWPVALLVLVGFVAALRVGRWRWLAFAYLVLVLLYIVVRGVDLPLRGLLTGYWYTDPQRLAALLPIFGVPLVTVGVAASSRAVVALVRRRVVGAWPRERWRPLPARTTAVVVAVVAVVSVVILPRTTTFKQSFAFIGHVYRIDPHAVLSTGLIDADEERMMRRIAEIVPPGVAIAGNPWDGSSMTWSLADRRAVYPHTGIALDPQRLLVADHLNDALTDPAVCTAVRDLGVGYVLSSGRHLWGGEPGASYPGFEDLVSSGVAELVAKEGDARLYRITACGE